MRDNIINALDAVSIYNTLKSRDYKFDHICDYLIKKGDHKGYERSDNLCIIYFNHYAVVITHSSIERLKRLK